MSIKPASTELASSAQGADPGAVKVKKEKKIPIVELFGPVIEGEGAIIGIQTMFIRFGLCIEENQRVLMSDWTLKPIKDIQIGEYVMACDLSLDRKRRIVASKVSHVVNMGRKDVIKLHGSDNTLLCTAEHEIYSYTGRSTNGQWRKATVLDDCKVPTIRIADESDEFWLGWLHGAFAGDGSIHKFKDTTWRMKLSCGDSEIRDKAHEILQGLGLDSHLIEHNPGNGKPLLPGVEVTNHTQVEAFRTAYLAGEVNADYRRGWLAGFFDTDGSWLSSGIKTLEGSGQIWFWQNRKVNEWKYTRCLDYLTSCGFSYSTHIHQNSKQLNSTDNVGISVNKTADFFVLCRGVLERKRPKMLNMRWISKVSIEVERLTEERTVWDITTEHGNFFAEGMLVHNCDYACKLCDSMHAVDPKLVKLLAAWRTQKEIMHDLLDLLDTQKANHIEHVTFSGGNPCIHDLSELVAMLHYQEKKVLVETQGTKFPEWLAHVDKVVISPKSPGMGEQFEYEVFKEFMFNVLRNNLDYSIKIVVFSAQDLEFAASVAQVMDVIVAEAANVPVRDVISADWQERFFLSLGNPEPPKFEITLEDDTTESPEMVVDTNLTSRMALVEELLLRYNLLSNDLMKDTRLSFARLLPQLHVLLFGNETEK